MPAPSVADAGAKGLPDSRDVHYTLSEDGSELDVVIDAAWLRSPQRVFPVTVDPTTEYWGDSVDCLIASATYENTDLCGGLPLLRPRNWQLGRTPWPAAL